MLAIAGHYGNVRLLLMDEPVKDWLRSLFNRSKKTVVELKRKGMTILLAEQNLQSALRVGDFHYIIDNGFQVFSGGKEDLSANEEVKIKYLGVGKSEKSRPIRKYPARFEERKSIMKKNDSLIPTNYQNH